MVDSKVNTWVEVESVDSGNEMDFIFVDFHPNTKNVNFGKEVARPSPPEKATKRTYQHF